MAAYWHHRESRSNRPSQRHRDGENLTIGRSDRDAPGFTLEVSFNTPGLSITIQD